MRGCRSRSATWTKELDSALFASRVATISLGVLGVLGAMLAVTGIFGMAAYSVSRRLRELGIRIALGAQRREVLGAALGRAFRLLVFGSVAGLVLGLAATKVLAFIVYEASPRDPLVLCGVVLIMLLLGLVAAWIPARRALGCGSADVAARGMMRKALRRSEGWRLVAFLCAPVLVRRCAEVEFERAAFEAQSFRGARSSWPVSRSPSRTARREHLLRRRGQ